MNRTLPLLTALLLAPLAAMHAADVPPNRPLLLAKTAETDLYSFQPDLFIFHVYGSHDKYEDIIRRTRERPTAEILMPLHPQNMKSRLLVFLGILSCFCSLTDRHHVRQYPAA